MNPLLQKLQPYPFEKLVALKAGCTPPAGLDHIALSIGEPRHPSPEVALAPLRDNLDQCNRYPLTKGSPELRQAIAGWLQRRFELGTDSVDADKHVIPVTGTREALFAFAQAVVARAPNSLVLCPNPFYQIYEGAALLAGATPAFVDCKAETDFLPDFDAVPESTWARCQLLYICPPGNPAGALMDIPYLQRLIELADRHDFIIASDECYSEIYLDEDHLPPGLLQTAARMGVDDYRQCVVFHSLSKRSNLPGLRSGFVAGDADILRQFLLYRTYHGCAMPPAAQMASTADWQDEQHVIENRKQYRQKFALVVDMLSATLRPVRPDAGFYLWARTDDSDTEFSRRLYAEQNISVLPGQYLSRRVDQINPGEHYIRMALVAPLDECEDAARRINQFMHNL